MSELYTTSLYTDANLVAYYKLNDVNDSKGGYTLTNYDTTTFTAGKYGNCANFGNPNTTKYLRIDSNLGITTGAFSFTMWVKLADPATNSWFIWNDDTTKLQKYIVYEGATSTISFVRFRVGVDYDTISQTFTLGTDWHHLAMTYDTTNIYGYIDAVQYGPQPASGVGNVGQGNRTSIGAYDTCGAGYSTTGLIDDIGIFSRALTLAEVRSLYKGGFQGGMV